MPNPTDFYLKDEERIMITISLSDSGKRFYFMEVNDEEIIYIGIGDRGTSR